MTERKRARELAERALGTDRYLEWFERFEDFMDAEAPPVRRFLATLRRR